jgi:ribonuclease R
MSKKGPKKKKNKAHRSMNASSLAQRILRLLQKRPFTQFPLADLALEMGMYERTGKILIKAALDILKSSEKIKEVNPETFQYKIDEIHTQGLLQLTSSGSGYVVPGGEEEDIFIRENNLGLALGGDQVKVLLHPQKGQRKLEGQIIEIIKRARNKFVGELQVSENHAFLITDKRKIGPDFYIPNNKLNGGKDGQIVVASLLSWDNPEKSPQGKVEQILGNKGDHDTEIHAILNDYGLPYSFEPEVENEANNISLELDPKEISKRRDLRKIKTFTIDPFDAKDFDDALSIQKIDNEFYEIGIHIADVTHYVRPGSKLEEEAQKRATSVYLVDRVVPMLPEILSNKVCSLRPNEDKFTFSALFQINSKGNIRDRWFGRTVIHSNRRFTYEEAEMLIRGEKDDFIGEEIQLMDLIAKNLRKKRMADGAIAFDRAEVKFRLDSNNEPIGASLKVAKDSNKLIEEFMLLANQHVANIIGREINGKQNLRTMIYRVHDHPDPEKLDSLSEFVRPLGYNLATQGTEAVRKSINSLLQAVKGTPEANMLETLTVRTMAKAIYSTQNIGHYGLAFKDYTHFTSPIRRYPDMMVHRLLQDFLNGQKSHNKEEYNILCDYCSNREQNANEAERASIKFMQAKYMDKYLGEEFEGIISGVTDWGVFVEIEKMGCEGLLRLAEFRDDYYILEKDHYRIVGERSGKIYSLGDTIRIFVKAVDLSKKTIDFGVAREKNQGQFLGKFHESKPFEIKTKRENSPLNYERSTGRFTSKFKAKGEKTKKSKKKRR